MSGRVGFKRAAGQEGSELHGTVEEALRSLANAIELERKLGHGVELTSSRPVAYRITNPDGSWVADYWIEE